mgnify:CR=1 FL=1
MAETNSPQYIEARQAWWDKRDLYIEELKNTTHFYQLEKALFLSRHLDPDRSGIDDDSQYQMLEDAAGDAQLKVLEVCSDFAKKKVSLDLAREEMKKAEKAFYDVKHSEKEVA